MIYPIPYAMLTSFCLAGCLMEHFALFPGWLALALTHPSSTPSMPKTTPTITAHAAQSPGLAIIYAIPKLALTVFIWVQLLHAPLDGTNWFSFLMLNISWGSTALVQVPLQKKIRKTGDAGTVRMLVRTDWVRVVTMAGHFVAVTLAVMDLKVL
ncbi:hypothetical protein L207DRAFT_580359 [Hyaloscypha variabilis F]|jgi:hypothetical protein|uniref:DUF1772-domain-containing protein n=1 Tax=Hyaloscypha variabilis (strain UAMH 11265 / GT02V1 / F) TaxID=1149755 RepID=A0A2J6RYC4_HYAVF|nr:hypothetical protein L207DRAFT_580359 [Hyaloscypha variabilis F]